MKLIGIILGLVFSTTVNAELLSDKAVNWEPIIGHTDQRIKAYFDRTGLSTSNTDVGKVSIGYVLVANDKPVDVPINGTVVKIQSIVRMATMNCDTGLTFPVVDFYFDKQFPSNTDKPIRTFMFDGMTGREITGKGSILYKLFCPEYI